MSFSTLNGDVDVTLPADTKARFKMRTDFGDIFTDFDVKMEANAPPVVEEQKDKNGKSQAPRSGGRNADRHHQRRRPGDAVHHLQRSNPDPQEVTARQYGEVATPG